METVTYSVSVYQLEYAEIKDCDRSYSPYKTLEEAEDSYYKTIKDWSSKNLYDYLGEGGIKVSLEKRTWINGKYKSMEILKQDMVYES